MVRGSREATVDILPPITFPLLLSTLQRCYCSSSSSFLWLDRKWLGRKCQIVFEKLNETEQPWEAGEVVASW